MQTGNSTEGEKSRDGEGQGGRLEKFNGSVNDMLNARFELVRDCPDDLEGVGHTKSWAQVGRERGAMEAKERV